MNRVYGERKAVVDDLMSQGAFYEIAKNAVDSEFCLAAIKKLNDQSQLLDIIEDSLDINVRFIALSKLTDKTMFEYLAKQKRYYRPYGDVCMRVTEKLDDTIIDTRNIC
ncbi:MAG: hypothetical protein LBL90_11130 [Prevotellaceae bacterium]|jgi:hypothetical protein|nr:hypothetical protein [Prevotellaceae bacterium]